MTTENNTKLIEQPSRELRDQELDAVSGGNKAQENQEQMQALKTFTQALQKAGQI